MEEKNLSENTPSVAEEVKVKDAKSDLKTVTPAKNQKDKKTKKAKTKEPSKLKRKAKETIGELKKVKWPTFKEVVKKTGVVLVVVLIFTLVVFGIDQLLLLLFKLLTKAGA